jgi:hypothetical protein
VVVETVRSFPNVVNQFEKDHRDHPTQHSNSNHIKHTHKRFSAFLHLLIQVQSRHWTSKWQGGQRYLFMLDAGHESPGTFAQSRSPGNVPIVRQTFANQAKITPDHAHPAADAMAMSSSCHIRPVDCSALQLLTIQEEDNSCA